MVANSNSFSREGDRECTRLCATEPNVYISTGFNESALCRCAAGFYLAGLLEGSAAGSMKGATHPRATSWAPCAGRAVVRASEEAWVTFEVAHRVRALRGQLVVRPCRGYDLRSLP